MGVYIHIHICAYVQLNMHTWIWIEVQLNNTWNIISDDYIGKAQT